MARVINSVIFFFLVIIGISCDGTSPNQPSAKVGFIIQARSISDTTASLAFLTTNFLESIPFVYVNGKVPDSIGDNIYYWSFNKVRTDSSIRYRIEWSNDVLEDDFYLPEPIDSLFCNGQYLPETVVPLDIYIDSASTYTYKWKTNFASEFHVVGYEGSIFSTYVNSKIVSDSEIVIVPDTQWFSTKYVKFNISSYVGRLPNSSTGPNKTSEKMFVYYSFNGPTYRSYCKIR